MKRSKLSFGFAEEDEDEEEEDEVDNDDKSGVTTTKNIENNIEDDDGTTDKSELLFIFNRIHYIKGLIKVDLFNDHY
jgi:hypothetical protein